MYGATTPCSKIGNSSIASEKVDVHLRALSCRWKRQSRKDFVIETSDGVNTTVIPTLPEFRNARGSICSGYGLTNSSIEFADRKSAPTRGPEAAAARSGWPVGH